MTEKPTPEKAPATAERPEAPRELIVKFKPGVPLPSSPGAASADDESSNAFAAWVSRFGGTVQPCFPLLIERMRRAVPGTFVHCLIDRFASVRFPLLPVEESRFLEEASLLPGVECVAVAPAGGPPPQSPDHTALQTYLDAGEHRVGAKSAWSRSGGTGMTVKVCVCDLGFLATHEDLPYVHVVPYQAPDANGVVGSDPNHGTNALGVIAAMKDGKGVTGISYGVKLSFAPVVQNRKATIDAAIASLNAGDVLVLEMTALVPAPTGAQVGGPQEFDLAIREALKCASCWGIVVVEAAGNGMTDLGGVVAERWVLGQRQVKYVWDRNSPDFDDSHAIMVGAGHAVDQRRVALSNYGNRVDCQGWGDSIVTAGEGNVTLPDPNNNMPVPAAAYSRGFGNTSGATAMVAGVVACLQGVCRGAGLPVLTPKQAREVVSDPTFGTPQPADDVGTPIGPLPNLDNLEGRMIEFDTPRPADH